MERIMFGLKLLQRLLLFVSLVFMATQITGCNDTSSSIPVKSQLNVISGEGINADALVDYRATVITGLPKGVYVTGKAQNPKATGDGTYFQIVDVEALEDDQLTLYTPEGFMGNLEITISVYHGDPDAMDTLDFVRTFNIEPTNNGMLFAQSGSVQFDDDALVKHVSLRTSNNHYVSANADGTATAQSEVIGSTETFRLIDLENGYVALQSASGKYLVAENNGGGAVNANRSEVGPWEQFELIELGDGKVNFRTSTGYYLVADDNGGSGLNANLTNTYFPEIDLGFPFAPVISTVAVEPSGQFSLVQRSNTSTPLDIIVNPLLDSNGVVNISGFNENARLFDRHGNLIELSESGSVELPITAITGLSVDVSNVSQGFYLNVELNTFLEEKPVSALQEVYIEVAEFTEAANGNKQLLVNGNRDEYVVERIANALVITEKQNPVHVVRVDMIKVKHIRFDDAFVSSSDFVTSVDISNVTNQLSDAHHQLVVVYNVPADAIVNNAIELGNGAFVIPATDIVNGLVDIDYSTIDEEFTADISVSAYAGTDEQIEFLNGQARATGYANAEVLAEVGFESSLVVGPDGVSAEARAYAGAGAVATAGGSVAVDGVGTVSAGVAAEATVSAEVGAQLEISNTQFQQEVGAGVEATASTSANVSVENDIIPGTASSAEGTVSVSTYARVGANNEISYGDGQYGAAGEAGAEAGIMATATGYTSGSVGGVGGNAEGGVSAGLGVGASAGGTAKFDNGEFTLGVSGELALLIGIELDVELVIDTNDVAETGELIGEGVITAAEAVGLGLIDVGTAINDFGLDAVTAINKGLITATDAIESGFITGAEAVGAGVITAAEVLADFGLDVGTAVATGFITAAQAVGEGFISVAEGINDFGLDVGTAIGEGFITGADAVAGGFIDVGTAIGSGFISGADAVAGGFIDVGTAIGSGFISGADAVAGGFIDVGTAIGSGFISGADAVAGGFIDVSSAIGSGFISGADAVANGFISEADAIASGFIDGAGGLIDDIGDGVGGVIDDIGGWF